MSIGSPVTVEWKGIVALWGSIGAKASTSSSRSCLDLGRVGGVVDGDLLGADAVSLTGGEDLPQGLGLPGEDLGGGAVDRRQGDPLSVGLEELFGLPDGK